MQFVLVLSACLATSASAQMRLGKHDFLTQAWSQGRTCQVCHSNHLLSGLRLPPGAVVKAVADLTPEEKAAVKDHPKNRLCYACHVGAKDSSSTDGVHSGDLSGKLPSPSTQGTSVESPSVTSGSQSTVFVRVNNQGMAGRDCLHCHDIHNVDKDHLLRDQIDSEQTQ